MTGTVSFPVWIICKLLVSKLLSSFPIGDGRIQSLFTYWWNLLDYLNKYIVTFYFVDLIIVSPKNTQTQIFLCWKTHKHISSCVDKHTNTYLLVLTNTQTHIFLCWQTHKHISSCVDKHTNTYLLVLTNTQTHIFLCWQTHKHISSCVDKHTNTYLLVLTNTQTHVFLCWQNFNY